MGKKYLCDLALKNNATMIQPALDQYQSTQHDVYTLLIFGFHICFMLNISFLINYNNEFQKICVSNSSVQPWFNRLSPLLWYILILVNRMTWEITKIYCELLEVSMSQPAYHKTGFFRSPFISTNQYCCVFDVKMSQCTIHLTLGTGK